MKLVVTGTCSQKVFPYVSLHTPVCVSGDLSLRTQSIQAFQTQGDFALDVVQLQAAT